MALSSAARWALGLFGVMVLVLLFGVLRLALYAQVDDEERLAAKAEYLGELARAGRSGPRPNIVFMLFDDLGYADLGIYGSQAIATPEIDAVAREGVRFTSFLSPSSVCSPARAGFLTGRYPPRAGVPHVLFPGGSAVGRVMQLFGQRERIPADEILLPEVLRAVGYRTGMVGKWHLGDHAPSLPNDLGFDSYFGALYSNDMTPFALYRDRAVAVEAPTDQRRLVQHYRDAAVQFIEAQRGDAPFFLYFAHSFPHVPLFTAPERAGTSRAGLYGDVVEALDWSVGELVRALRDAGELEDTIFIVTSDNGPWYEGSPGPSRGRKNQSWEGGFRVPFIVRWPTGGTPADVAIATPSMGIDLVPTLLSLLELDLPADRAIDGRDVASLWRGREDPQLAERELLYFRGDELEALRRGDFKLWPRVGVRSADFGDALSVRLPMGPLLFDLSLDPDESYDLSQHPDAPLAALQERFSALASAFRENPRGWR